MTFPKGYNAPSLKQENIIVKRVVPDNYTLGIIEIKSPCGNPIKIYNLERTLCDIVRGSGSDIQIVNGAMKRYAASKEEDIHKLMKYAGQLRVKLKAGVVRDFHRKQEDKAGISVSVKGIFWWG